MYVIERLGEMVMDIALALLTGLAAGGVELWLLTVLVKALLSGDTLRAAVILPVKLLVLAAGLVPTLLLAPKYLWLAGCALAAPIVVGAPIISVILNRKGGGKP